MSEVNEENMVVDTSFADFLAGKSGQETSPVQGGDSNVVPTMEAPPQVSPVAQVPIVKEVVEPIETPFFKLEVQNENMDLNDFNNIANTINSKYGVEVKEPKDILAVLQKIDELNEKSTSFEQQVKQLKIYEQTLSSMPDDLKGLVYDWVNGNDYTRTITDLAKGTAMDFTKEASSYDVDSLILFYNPELTKEDIEELDPKVKTTMHSSAIRNYSADKERLLDRGKRIQAEAEQRKTTYLSSVDESLMELKRKYPEFNAKQLNEIKSKMISGYSLYDGERYTKDAAVKIAMAEYGESALNTLKMSALKQYQAQVSQEVSKERELFAMHQSDRPTMPSSESFENERSKKVEEITSFLRKKETF